MPSDRKQIKGTDLHIESIVSARNQKPYVELSLGSEKVQMETEQAMELVVHIIECVEGAISDAFLWQFFSKTLGAEDTQCAQIIQHFREYRQTFPVVRGWHAG